MLKPPKWVIGFLCLGVKQMKWFIVVSAPVVWVWNVWELREARITRVIVQRPDIRVFDPFQ
jgi:hypothetical protein